MSGAGSGPARGWPTGPRLHEFEDFDRKYRPIVLEYLRSFGGTVSYLDDAVQDAFATVAWRWEEVRRYTSPRGFLFRVARQRWLKHNRYRNNRCAPLPDDTDNAQAKRPGQPNGDHAPRVQAVRDALARLRPLPTRQREVTFLCLVADFDEETVAEVLGISVGALKQHRARALKRLRQISIQIGNGDGQDLGGGPSRTSR